MASNDPEVDADAQLKEVESKLDSVCLSQETRGERENPAVGGKVPPHSTHKTGNDALGDNMSQVVYDGTAAVTETTCLHGQAFPDSKLQGTKGDNPDLHVEGDNSVDYTNTANVECIVCEEKDASGTTGITVAQNMSSSFPEGQIDCADLIGTVQLNEVAEIKEVQNSDQNDGGFEEAACDDSKQVNDKEVIQHVCMSDMKNQDLERGFGCSERSEEESINREAGSVVCSEDGGAKDTSLQSENMSIPSGGCQIAASDDNSHSAAKTECAVMDGNVADRNSCDGSAYSEAAKSEIKNIEFSDSAPAMVTDGDSGREKNGKKDEREQMGESKFEETNEGQTNPEEEDTTLVGERVQSGTEDLVSGGNDETPEPIVLKDVRPKSSRITFTPQSKKYTKIKSGKISRFPQGKRYNELLRKTREKSVEKVEVVEEDSESRDTSQGAAGDPDIKRGHRKRWTKRSKRNEETDNTDRGLADEEQVEKHQNFDDGSVDEDPGTPAERTGKKKKGKKKNRQQRSETDDNYQEQSFANCLHEQDYGYSCRYVYYDTGERNDAFEGGKPERHHPDHSHQYYQGFEDDQISDHSYRGHRPQDRGRGHERGHRHGTREFRRSKIDMSESSRRGGQRSEGFSVQDFRRSGSSVSESSTQSGQMYGDLESVDRSRDTGQHYKNLTITACGDGTRHVATAANPDGYSSFVNSVGSDTGRQGKKKKKNKKKKHTEQDEPFTQESDMVMDQQYSSHYQPDENTGGAGYEEHCDYSIDSQRTDCIESHQDQFRRQGNTKSKDRHKRNERESYGEIRGEYTKLNKQSTDYHNSLDKNRGIVDFEDSERQQTSRKHKKKHQYHQDKNVDDRHLDQEDLHSGDGLYVAEAEEHRQAHPRSGSKKSRRHPEQVALNHQSLEGTSGQNQMETRQDSSVGDSSSQGRPNQKRDRHSRRGGGGGRHPQGSNWGQEVDHANGAGDGYRGRGGRRNVHGGGPNLNNPNQRSHRPGPRQNHNPQYQGQQHYQVPDYQHGQGYQYSPDSRQNWRGGSGRRGGQGDRSGYHDQQNVSGGAAGYSPMDAHNYGHYGQRRGRQAQQHAADRASQQCSDNQQSNEGRQGGHKNKNKRQHPKKPMEKYDTYWSPEDVSAGLKRGTLIEGPIRVNPRNYNEAYVPLPDGTADVFISGLINRNRTLNGDIVAVQVLERENWKVFMEDLEDYEAKVKPDKGQGEGENNEDSGPDVVIEEEVEVVNQDAKNDKDQKDKHKRKNHTPRKTYTSVKDVVSAGSPMAKSLFESGLGGTGDQGVQVEGVSVQGFVQKTGKVVAVLEAKHSRASSGHIKLMQDKNSDLALFSPTDSRVPRIQIPMNECPKNFIERPDDYAKTLFIARITEWHENSMFAKGHLARSLGEAGQIEPETEAILIEHNVEFDEFPEEVLQCLPQDLPWVIPDSEYDYRRDLRRQCIFTIDPSTARDLDDAVSVEVLGNDRYEVGVHIADVSFFLEESTPLDIKAAGRATSVYLVQKVIPMLPRLLCEELCSLNPDEDRLAFSVIWTIDGNGEVEEEWFGRTVIRSCVKLSYDHAQGFIMEPDRNWKAAELPPISKGFSVDDIKKRVLQLDKIAKCLRKKRFDSGALRLDQVKLSFSLDEETGMPNGYFVYEQKDSNRLIEEFMLLANMAVAHKIYQDYPDKALLRRHPPPQNKMVDDLKDLCKQLGVALDLSNSQTWQQSLNIYQGTDDFSAARMQVLVALSSKPMQNAKYFCSGMIADPEVYRHYALNVPLYTHFTSPIRRYADVMVHRLLSASLKYTELTSKDRFQLHKQAEHCNDKKYMSKRVQEMSSELFFAAFIREAGPFEEKAMVMGVMDHSLDVFILKFGVSKRIYCDQLDLKSQMYIRDHKKPQLTLVWKSDNTHQESTQIITIFTSVTIFMLGDKKDPLRWKALLKRPTTSS